MKQKRTNEGKQSSLPYRSDINVTHSSTGCDHIGYTKQITSMNTLWSEITSNTVSCEGIEKVTQGLWSNTMNWNEGPVLGW